jgi:hypothetical protein
MRFRKLRTAWSVTWGLSAVLLTVCWVWSATHHYRYPNDVNDRAIQIESYKGTFEIVRWGSPNSSFLTPYVLLKIHYVVFALVAVSAAIAPFLTWRFRLRTLLIATTVVAVVLGIIAYVVHNKLAP